MLLGKRQSVYGVGDIEMALRRAGKEYVPGVSAKHAFNSWGKPYAVAGTAKDIAADLPPEAWRRLSADMGTKGERLHDWAFIEFADLDTADVDADFGGLWTRGLLVRGNISDGDLPSSRPGSSAGHAHGNTGADRGPPMGDRGQLQDREERA